MGVRLAVHNLMTHVSGGSGSGGSGGTANHNELLHRDDVNQHPIYAISGLQEILNTIELNLLSLNQTLINTDANLRQYTDQEILRESNVINARIDDLKILNEIYDTNTIKVNYNNEEKSFSADVIKYNDPNNTNALKLTDKGLYVQKLLTNESKTISWMSSSISYSLNSFFNDSIKFSHNDTNEYINIYDITDTEWNFNSSTGTIHKQKSTETYNGLVSNTLYDTYNHSVCIKSTSSENNIDGVVLAFIFDEYDRPHTLSLLFQRGGDNYLVYKCAVIYNFKLPGEELICNFDNINSNTGWDDYPNGISVFIEKLEKEFNISVSQYGFDNTNIIDITTAKTEIESNKEFDFNIKLNEYSWGHYFVNKIRYGYSNMRQSNSYFNKIFFLSNDMRIDNVLSSNVKISNQSNNGISIKDDGIYSEKFRISSSAYNALKKYSDGYYVSEAVMQVSNTRLNGLVDEGGGKYYVHKSHSFIRVNQPHSFNVGDFIYYDNRTDLYQLAIAKDDFDINIVGMVNYVYSSSSFEYVCSGFVETDLFTKSKNYVQGMPLYISDTTPGKVTQTQPEISKAVGYPIADIGLIISIERGIQYSSEAKIGDFKTSANDYNIRSDGFIKIKEGINYNTSLVQKLINSMDSTFKNNYMSINTNDGTMSFINTDQLYLFNNVIPGLNLFIKAF